MDPTELLDSDYADLLDTDLLVPHYLIACWAYYEAATPTIDDHQFDLLARRLDAEWEEANHPHRRLIDRSALRSGGSYLSKKYPLRVIGAAKGLIRALRISV